MHRFLLAGAILLSFTASVAAQEPPNVTLMSRDLTDIPGKEGTMLTWSMRLAERTLHRHDAHAFVYVLEGSVVMQVKGAEPVTLYPGQTFYEGRNASKTEPAKFLVVFVKNKGAPILTPVE
jgi:quercetin dioxygenase-like cupin family protein